MNKDLIIVIDGNSIAYRAFYALPMLANKNGEITNAIYGFVNMMFKAIDELNPTHIACVFDFPAKLARHEIYAEYKGTRKPMPPELASQMDVLKRLLTLMGICVFEERGLEADDIVGSISKKFSADTIVITGDRDCLQLIDDTTKVMLTKKGLSNTVLLDTDGFVLEYGFPPINIVDLKAIMGDSSDNIPGVAGIGEKGATDLIAQFLTLENVYGHLNELKPRTKQLLEDSREVAFMSKTLATINTNVEIKKSFEELKLNVPFSQNAIAEINRLQLFSLLKKDKYFSTGNIDKLNEKNEITIINILESEQLKQVLQKVKNNFAFVVTSDKIEFAFDEKISYKIKIKETLIDDGIDFREALKILKPVLENENIKKICFNFKTVYYFLKQFDIKIKSLKDSVGKFIAIDSKEFLTEPLISDSEILIEDCLISSWLIDANVKMEKIEDFFVYSNCINCASSLFIIDQLNKIEMKKLGLTKLYYNVELPLLPVLIEMEEDGFKIDEDVLAELSATYKKELNFLTNQIYEQAGEEFNIKSPKQLSEILFVKLGLAKFKKDSTAIDALNSLRGTHSIIENIIEYRSTSKLYDTYVTSFEEILKKTNGFIHTTFNPVGTQTGRLSSNNPNLQNIPIRTEKGKELRKVFISRFEDGKIISADYNQIELRLVANFSKDERMIASYLSGKDIHRTTASQIFNKTEKEITSEERRQAKAVNFGIIYGISPFGLSEQIGIFPAQAAAYIEKYFENFPKVRGYLEKSVEDAKANDGYVSTVFGRKRRINELFNSNGNIRHFGERAAKNMPLQGSASDIIKVAMIRTANRIKTEGLKACLILQIHDELIIDSPKNEVERATKILKEEMEKVVNLTVPILADVEIGNNLFEV